MLSDYSTVCCLRPQAVSRMKSSLVQKRGIGELRGPEDGFQDGPTTGQWNV